MDVRFENLNLLHLMWVVLALYGVALFGFARKRRQLERFASAGLLGHLLGPVSRGRQWAKAGLTLAALAVLVLSIIDPRWGRYYEDIPRRGIDIIFVLDVSKSMLAVDPPPSRLERAKQYISDVVDAAGGDRVGLIVFAGEPVLKSPLTANYNAFRMTVNDLSVRSSPRGGSLIGDGIRLAADSFVDEAKEHKAIVIISDGEDQESYPTDAAREAFQNRGIRVYTVGLGSEGEGSRIPVESSREGLYVQHEGREVWTRMHADTLREIALAGGGAFIPAGTKATDLGKLLYQDRIARMEQREFQSSRVERHRIQFQWFAGAALLLLCIEMIMTERRATNAARGPWSV